MDIDNQLRNFTKSKLIPKIKFFLKMYGYSDKVDISNIIEGVKELGLYEIVWSYNNERVIDIKLISNLYHIEIQYGKYILVDLNGGNVKELYSSEFIELSLKDFREYKLNKLLHIK